MLIKVSEKFAIWFFSIHSIVPTIIFVRLFSITDGTERWANTLILYLIDIFLSPIFIFFRDSTMIKGSASSFINTCLSFFVGGFVYACIGYFIGYLFFEKRKGNKSQSQF